jgi:hypothetical protein
MGHDNVERLYMPWAIPPVSPHFHSIISAKSRQQDRRGLCLLGWGGGAETEVQGSSPAYMRTDPGFVLNQASKALSGDL